MDLTDVISFLRQHWLEISSGLCTLAVSLWIAFGPLRHRLPRFFSRIGKYSATLKLLSLSALCWFFFYRCLTDDVPSLAINWMLGFLGVALLAGAAFVVTRKQGEMPRMNACPKCAHDRTAAAGVSACPKCGHESGPATPTASPRIRSVCRPKATSAPL
jgi:hypothetical protein